jgi:phenylpyruvate tautomerase PptA (4-oxalocrotonate tautomerase family)
LHSESELSYGAAMPKLDLTYPAGALSDDAKRGLPSQLAAALLRWEGAPDTEFFRSITWAHVHELAAEAVHTADGQAELSHFVVDVTVPAGALSDRRKGGLVEEMSRLVREAAGLGEADGVRVWVLIHEVPEGNWGAAGQIVRFEQLRAAAKAEREKAEQAAAPA